MEDKKKYDFELKLFGLSSEDTTDSREFHLYREIKSKFEDALYCRFNKGIGHLILKQKNQDFASLFSDEKPKEEAKDSEQKKDEEAEPEPQDSNHVAQFKLTATHKDSKETKTLRVNVYELSELEKENFWRNHGKHFDSLIKQQYGQSIKYKVDGKAEFSNTSIFLAGVKFKTVSEAKNVFKKLLKSKKPGDKVDGIDSHMLKEILKFHPKHDEKMKDFDFFEVNFHPDYPETKCFLAVDTSGAKNDFSYVKCMKRMADDISKRR